MPRRPPKSRPLAILQYLLEHVVTRALLSVAIVISLIPHEWMHATDAWFLAVFVPEFIGLVILSSRKETNPKLGQLEPETGWQVPPLRDIVMLALDFVALLSFIPFKDLPVAWARWFRLFRLTRMLMLLRFWAPLLRDIYTVMRQRERGRQVALMAGAVAVICFAGVIILNHATETVGDDFDGDGRVGDEHDHSFFVRVWWAFRQIEDPGNMLASPHEVSTLVVSAGLTVFGLFVFSFLIGVGSDAVRELMMLSKLRPSGLTRHTVLINITTGTRQLLFELLGEYRKLLPTGLRALTVRWFRELRTNARRRREFVIVGKDEDQPDFLREPELARIVYRHITDEDDEAFLDRADIPEARRVVLLADVDLPDPDDVTIRTLLTIVERLRETQPHDRARSTDLIAEILDESNIGAARKALERAQGHVDAHIVPTERLLALFMACVARRPGVSRILTHLLPSAGYELYTYDYRLADGNSAPRRPSLPEAPRAVLEALAERALARPVATRVVPVGILTARPDSGHEDPTLLVNPATDSKIESGESFTGFVAIARNLRIAAEFARDLPDSKGRQTAADPGVWPELEGPHVAAMRRVLICGFRSATVNLIEALITAEPQVEILVLVTDEAAKAAALDDFDAHSSLVEGGLLEGLRGTFVEGPGGMLQCVPVDRAGERCGRIWVEVGDWTSSRQLTNLPRSFERAAEMDAILLLSSEHPGDDAKATTALMKLDYLRDHDAETTGSRRQQRIVAEMSNVDLAKRLARRYADSGRDDVAVFSIHELRALFMFQSVVVPTFSQLYGELLAPWGQSFVQLRTQGGRGRCTFADLAAHLHAKGKILVAVELEDGRLFVAEGDPEHDDFIDLAALRSVWVIQEGAPGQTTTVDPGSSAKHPIVAPPPPSLG